MMKQILTFFILVGLTACGGKNISPQTGLVGTWRLKSYCKTTSSSTPCTPTVVPNDKSVYLSFASNLKFNETYDNVRPAEHAFFGCGPGSYKMEDGNVRIYASCMSSLSGRLVKLISVSDKELILDPYDTGNYVFERR